MSTLSRARREELKLAFDTVDLNESGRLDYNQLVILLKSIGVVASKKDLDAVAQEFKHRGAFTFEDVLLIGSVTYTDETIKNDLISAFKVMDTDRSGFVSTKELKHVLQSLGLVIKLSDQELQTLMHDADPTNSGLCEYEKFIDSLIRR
eukprot:GDKJ01038430.1.p1 GENE.GDKJ01038430.1~~GDKJ01038430.1.p1  ORF type:complete len:149 (+),score=27.60 GDKJ01038430.1:23-469(+)